MWSWKEVPPELQNAFQGYNGSLYLGIKIQEPRGQTGDDILRELENKDATSLSRSLSASSGSVYTPEFDPDVRRGSMETDEFQSADDFEFDLFLGENGSMVLPVPDLTSILNNREWTDDISFAYGWMHTASAWQEIENPPTTVCEPTLKSSFFKEEYDSYMDRHQEAEKVSHEAIGRPDTRTTSAVADQVG